MEKLKMGLTID